MRNRLLSTSQAALGLSLFATIALPISSSGFSLLDVFLDMLRRSPVAALWFLVMFASPQLFGLAVAIAGVMRDRQRATNLVKTPVVILQGVLVVVGMSVLNASQTVAPYALAGFAVVTSIYYMYTSADADAASASSSEGLSLHWYIRWGALLVTGLGLWLRLQSIGTLRLGIALDVAIVTASLLLVSVVRRRSLA